MPGAMRAKNKSKKRLELTERWGPRKWGNPKKLPLHLDVIADPARPIKAKTA